MMDVTNELLRISLPPRNAPLVQTHNFNGAPAHKPAAPDASLVATAHYASVLQQPHVGSSRIPTPDAATGGTSQQATLHTPEVAPLISPQTTVPRPPEPAAMPMPPAAQKSVLQQCTDELIRAGYTPKTTLRFIEDVGDYLDPPSKLMPPQPTSIAPTAVAPTRPPILPVAIDAESLVERQLLSWGFPSSILKKASHHGPLTAFANGVASWRTWAEGVGIKPSFITLIFSLAIDCEKVKVLGDQLTHFSSLPFCAVDGKISFARDHQIYRMTPFAHPEALELQGCEVAMLLDRPSGLFVLWLAVMTWDVLSLIAPTFTLFNKLCDSGRGDDILTAFVEVAPHLIAVGFTPSLLRNLMEAPLPDAKLRYANSYRSLFAAQVMTPQEFVELCYHPHMGAPELLCLLVERAGNLAQQRDEAAGPSNKAAF